jgi:hypothetical protein
LICNSLLLLVTCYFDIFRVTVRPRDATVVTTVVVAVEVTTVMAVVVATVNYCVSLLLSMQRA